VVSLDIKFDLLRNAHTQCILHREYTAAMNKMTATTKKGPVAVRTSFVRGEKSMLHSGRRESKLNVNVFINSNVESIMGGQLTPLSTPSLLLARPAINRTHEKDCSPDRMSFVPFAAATKGGNVRDEDKTANNISRIIATTITMISLDSGHFLQTKLSV
jgi:hypothetical protein